MTKAHPKAWLLVLTVSLGTLINPLNSSMIAIALTRIQSEFTLSFADVTWMTSIFYLASAVGQPVAGKLSDMFGPRRLFITGLILVAIPCILAPFSPNYGFLLACRAIQAIGSSTLFPSGMSMIRTYITEKLARAIAIISIFASTTSAFGPTIGGILISNWNWEVIFIINIPIIIVGLILAISILPKDSTINVDLKRIDLIGMILFTVSITSLILFLLSFTHDILWNAFIVFVISGILFYTYEKRKSEPFIDVESLKKNKIVSIVYIQFILFNFVYYNFFIGFPTFFQQVRGYSEELTGIIMLALAGFGVIATPFATRIIGKRGSKLALLIGGFSLLLGTGLLMTYSESSPLFWMLIILAVLGISNGFTNISVQTVLYDNVKEEDTGSSSGLLTTTRYLGSILSGSFLGITFTSNIGDAHIHNIAIVCFVLSFVIIFLAFKIPRKIKRV